MHKMIAVVALLAISLSMSQFAYASNWSQIPVEVRQGAVDFIGPIGQSANISESPAIAERSISPQHSYGIRNSLIVCGDILCSEGDNRVAIMPWHISEQKGLINSP